MPIAHAVASGMNGLRAAGDLVVRLQMTRGMRLAESKRFVAERLGVSETELSDPLAMHERRGELGLGRVFETEACYPQDPSPSEAKARIADLLELPINSVELARARARAWA